MVACLLLMACEKEEPVSRSSKYSKQICATSEDVNFVGCVESTLAVGLWTPPYQEGCAIELEDPKLDKKFQQENLKIDANATKRVEEKCSNIFSDIAYYAKKRNLLGWHELQPILLHGFEGNIQGSWSKDGGSIDGHMEDNLKVAFRWGCAGKYQIGHILSDKVYFMTDQKVKRPSIRFRFDVAKVGEIRDSEKNGHIAHPNEFVEVADEATIKISPAQMEQFLGIMK